MQFFRKIMGKSSIDDENSYQVGDIIISDEVPALYRDCLNKQQKINWLQSAQGQCVLKQRPLLLRQYNSGELLRLIDNPHWKIRLEQWLTVDETSVDSPSESSSVPYGLSLPKTQEEIEQERGKRGWLHEPIKYSQPFKEMFLQPYLDYQHMTLSLEQKYELLTQGFTILRNVIPLELLQIAALTVEEIVEERKKYIGMTKLENLQSKGLEDPYFLSGVSNDPSILALYYATPVYSIIESILHNPYNNSALGNAVNDDAQKDTRSHSDQPLRPFRNAVGGAQIAYRFTHYHSLQKNKFTGEEGVGGQSWHIDGLGRGSWGTFSFLVGVPLSNQFETFSGNLCVHPGSHHTLQPYLKEYARLFNTAETFDEKYGISRTLPQMDLGEPTQVTCAAGDVVIALHKVAHLGGPNFSNEVRKMLYFRPAHRNHMELRLDALDNMWMEYEGMEDVIW